MQHQITKERIEEMIHWEPRRFRLKDFDRPLKPPETLGDWQKDWNLIFPFKETFVPSFQNMCSLVEHIPFSTKGTAYYTFLKNVTDEDIDNVQKWLKMIEPYIAIRDCLALSFALDYDREGGNPANPRTPIGSLREQAKTYGKSPTDDTYAAACELIQACLQALRKLTCYNSATCVTAMPPSDPAKPFDLPRYLAKGVASGLGKKDFSEHVRTIRARPSVRETPCNEKLPTIEDTVAVDSDVFGGQIVLLIDDLYQSGVTMNYVAMMLLEAGTKKVYGLACEKTCSNDDNVSRC